MNSPSLRRAHILPPKAGFLSRTRLYLREMYPPGPRLFLAGLLSASLFAVAGRVHGEALAWTTPHVLIATAGVFLFLLMLRLMDELKDVDVDRALFAHRPLPSGRVKREDIVASLVVTVAAYLALHLAVPEAWPVGLVVLLYAFLMFRYFFAPRLLRRYLLLNLLTHNPVVPLLMLWVLAVFAGGRGLAFGDLAWSTLTGIVGMVWGVFLAWEIGRKIRAAEEENAYVTYSQILGRRTAVAVMLGLQTLALAGALILQRKLGWSWTLPATMLVGWSTVLFAGLRFWLRPSPRSSQLGAFAERYVVFTLAALLLGASLT